MENAKKVLREWARNNPCIRRMYIFGSRAMGDERGDSDLDVAVEISPLPDDSNASATWMFENETWVNELQPLLKYKLHLVLLEPNNKKNVHKGVEQADQLIYEKDV